MSAKKLKTMSDLGIHVYNDHKLPVTRRDFLASGLLGLTGMALVPSLSLYSPRAVAEVVAEGPLGLGFLCFEGAGGMNIAGGNFMVGMGADEEQENFGTNSNSGDYILLGLPPSMHPAKPGMLNKDYGIVLHSTSGILAGMNEILVDDAIKESIDGIIICGRTSDDSSENPINVAFQVQKAGAHGKLVQLIGNSGTPTGSKSPAISTQIKSELRATRITNFSEGSGLLSIGDDAANANFLNIGAAGGTERIRSFLSSITGLSKVRLDKLVNQEMEIKSIKTAQGASKDMFQKFSPATLNPVNTPDALAKLQASFGANGAMGVANEGIASIANLVTDRIAGVGSITVGGCDYHSGNAADGLAKDKEIGRYIAKCIKLAQAKEQNLFIHLYTDGGVGGDNAGTTDDTPAGAGRVNWTGDNGTTSSQVCIVYKHNHKRSLQGSLILDGKTRQVGFFRKGGGINLTSSSVSNNVDEMWKAVTLNYMACMSKAAPDAVVEDVKKRFKELFPAETLPADADKLIRFKSIVA